MDNDKSFIKLRACPTCGAQPNTWTGFDGAISFGCLKCHTRTRCYINSKSAAAEWNGEDLTLITRKDLNIPAHILVNKITILLPILCNRFSCRYRQDNGNCSLPSVTAEAEYDKELNNGRYICKQYAEKLPPSKTPKPLDKVELLAEINKFDCEEDGSDDLIDLLLRYINDPDISDTVYNK